MKSHRNVSRRQVLGLMTGALGAATVGRIAHATAAQSGAANSKGAIIRTILRDLEPSAIKGHLLFHEHLSFGPAFFERMRPANAPRPATPPPPNYISDPAKVIEEVKASAKEGIGLIVDGGHPDMATSYNDLKLIAEKTGVHVVASGGYYLQNMYPPEVATETEEQLLERLVNDAQKYRWGALGEIGSSPTMTDDERKVFRVMGRAVQRTNLPLFSHTPHSGCKGCALEQLELLQKSGVDMKRVCIGHLSDIGDDPAAETHKTIGKTGAFLGFDTVGHRLGPGDSVKVGMLLKLLDAGFEDQILLSSDFASDPETKANGGAGYSSVSMVFLPKLRYAGVKEATIVKIMTENPKRFLAFVPRS
jgi:predicted metal-dependent phosphotriesterase family hydrolase